MSISKKKMYLTAAEAKKMGLPPAAEQIRRWNELMAKDRGKKKNPTKAQRAEKTRKLSAKRRVAVALAKYLKQQNPGSKLAGARVEKLAGGVLKITPIKANRGRAR